MNGEESSNRSTSRSTAQGAEAPFNLERPKLASNHHNDELYSCSSGSTGSGRYAATQLMMRRRDGYSKPKCPTASSSVDSSGVDDASAVSTLK